MEVQGLTINKGVIHRAKAKLAESWQAVSCSEPVSPTTGLNTHWSWASPT